MFDWIFGKQKLQRNTMILIAICDELHVRTEGKYISKLSGMAWKLVSDCGNRIPSKACPDLDRRIKSLVTIGDALDLYISINEVHEDSLRIKLGLDINAWQTLRAKKFKSYNKETGLGL